MNMYNPYQVNPYYQPQIQPQQQQVQQQTMPQQQIQNGGFVIVRSEAEAKNYPVAPGSSITIFNETQPYCYKKTMGFSPLDHPTFERYKIVKEEVVEEQQAEQSAEPVWKADFDAFQEQLDDLRKEVQALKSKARPSAKKKEEVKDDTE